MEIVADQKQVSATERAEISRQVKAELIEHLYQGCLPGTVSGIPVGIAVFIDYYHHTPTNLLISWYIFYNLALIALTTLYFIYKKYKPKVSLNTWLWAYSIVMSICAISWGICILLLPDNITRQYFAFIALFLISTGYATGSIGVFELCVVTLGLIVIPLIIWCFLKGSFFYYLVGFFSMIYLGFMYSINYRSTQWFKDSLKLKLENTLVSYQANHDLLTNLPNQRLLPQYVESAIQSVQGTSNTFALACFSLNRMEIINDSLGHQAGNLIIQSVANRLIEFAKKLSTEATQYIVTISRKDTFNILLAPLKTDEAERKIKALFAVLDEPFYLEKKGIKMTASIGASLFGQDGQEYKSLTINADAAMLKAKQAGGNVLEFYRAEINATIPKQLELETDLHDALKNNQLLLYYQPLIDLKKGRISGMEALIRWQHPTLGFISPVQFIPLAEETGLIIPIGEWVLQEACKQTRIWHEMGFSWLRVAVNLSAKQLRQENIVGVIANILEKTNFSSQFLELEITETAILDETVIHLMKEFKNLGLSLAVDDFGTGYSGLSYLKRFAIDKLKIDQSFVRDIPGNTDSVAIVSAIIAVAKEMKINTLAEGVEQEDQLQFLKDKGCDYIQGYYFSKPLAVDLFTQFLLKQQETLKS